MVFSVSAYATGGDGWISSSKGRIIVDKITIPSGDYQSFEFKTKGTNYKSFSLTDESAPNIQVLSPGKYSVSESVPIGWDLTSATCDSGTPSSISLTKGKTVRCTFVNTKWSNIVIIKYAYGNYSYNLSELFDSEKFNFTGTLGNFTIKTYFGLGAKAFVNITPGNYSVAELVPAGWNLVFTACSDGSPVSNIELKRGESIACIFKNKQAPQEATLTVTKTVVNDNGGTKTVFDFPLFVNGIPVVSGASNTLTPGMYIVSETNDPGYAASVWGGDCAPDGTITLAAGDNKTCTITNDDIPASTTARLTVTKVVVNDNGGFLNALDFALMINGQFVSNGTPNVMNPGTYTVSEEQIQGYSATIGGDCAANGTVTLNAGQNKECIITNNDIPSNLTVVKIIINDNGGNAVLSDFTPLTINGNAVVNGTKNTLDSGVYRIGEANKPGYTATIGGDCAENGLVFIGLGEEKTCTITNNDDPAHILVIKNLINDRGGNNVESDFMMHITGTVGTFDFAGSSIGTNVVVNAGNYVVTEDPNIGPNFGYQSGLSADCTGTVTSGETKICTIINDDVAPTLTLVKNVTNNNGGTAGINNFGMTINGSPVISGEVFIAFSNTPYVIDEAGLAGYQFVNITGTGCPTQLGGTVTLNEGESVTCTITNDDVPGKVRIIKNTTGGDGTFNFTITGPSSSAPAVSTVNGSGDTTMSVNTSSYSVSESVPQGWNLTSAVCDSGTPGSFLVALNSTVTCTFENTKLPTLTVNKVLIPSNDTGLFNLQMDNITRITNVGDNGTTGPIIMSIGQHLVGELAGTNTTLGNYNSTIGGACAVNGSITLVAGQDAVCTITNTKIVV